VCLMLGRKKSRANLKEKGKGGESDCWEGKETQGDAEKGTPQISTSKKRKAKKVEPAGSPREKPRPGEMVGNDVFYEEAKQRDIRKENKGSVPISRKSFARVTGERKKKN